MAGYQPRNSGNNTNRPGNMSQATSGAPVKAASTALFSSGLFAPEDASKTKAVASVKTKEAITIPAGSYVNLYEVEDRKGDKSPIFKLQIRAGKTQA